MTDAQFGALLTAVLAGLGGIAGMIKWAVSRITKAWDDQSRSNLRLADAQIEFAAAMSAQRADLDGIMRFIAMASGMRETPTASDEDRPGSERRRVSGHQRSTTAGRGVPIQQSRREPPTPNYRAPREEAQEDDDR